MKKRCIFLAAIVLLLGQCRPKEQNAPVQFPGKPAVPAAIKKEHVSLLDKIHAMTLFQDSAGRVAIRLDELMRHHFKEEEDYVLPPLGLLPMLSAGKLPGQTKDIILLTEKLKAQSSHISAEHQMIKALLGEMKAAAPEARIPSIIEFEKELGHHAETEEEIFFPAAILIGEYLKMKTES